MHLISAFSVVLLASHPTLAHVADDEDAQSSDTMTPSASIACPTGEALSKYQACSASVASKGRGCDDSDLTCLCSAGNDGFKCMTSYCRANTEALCVAFLLVSAACGSAKQSAATLLDLSCPVSLADFLNSPSFGSSTLPPPSTTKSTSFASKSGSVSPPESSRSTDHTNGNGGGVSMTIHAPTETNAAGPRLLAGRGGRRDIERRGMDAVLAMGLFVSLAVGGLAAFL